MDKVNDENKKERIPCESEMVYKAINNMKRNIKNKTEKNSSKKIKSIFKSRKKAELEYENERRKRVYLSYMNDAVNDSYYSITGYRYYVEKLCDYVETTMPSKEDPEEIFISVYNSNISYMSFICKKLEKKLDEYATEIKTEYEFDNKLYRLMKMFVALAYKLELDKYENFAPGEYKVAVLVYCKKLKTGLPDLEFGGE